jgi:hypothetical protein
MNCPKTVLGKAAGAEKDEATGEGLPKGTVMAQRDNGWDIQLALSPREAFRVSAWRAKTPLNAADEVRRTRRMGGNPRWVQGLTGGGSHLGGCPVRSAIPIRRCGDTNIAGHSVRLSMGGGRSDALRARVDPRHARREQQRQESRAHRLAARMVCKHGRPRLGWTLGPRLSGHPHGLR